MSEHEPTPPILATPPKHRRWPWVLAGGAVALGGLSLLPNYLQYHSDQERIGWDHPAAVIGLQIEQRQVGSNLRALGGSAVGQISLLDQGCTTHRSAIDLGWWWHGNGSQSCIEAGQSSYFFASERSTAARLALFKRIRTQLLASDRELRTPEGIPVGQPPVTDENGYIGQHLEQGYPLDFTPETIKGRSGTQFYGSLTLKLTDAKGGYQVQVDDSSRYLFYEPNNDKGSAGEG